MLEFDSEGRIMPLRKPKMEAIIDSPLWSLYEDGKQLPPLKFTNGKTQEDIVKECLEAIDAGNKIILIKGGCGTGKSAIALNIARKVGKTSIVVPVKALQKQYEKDYTKDKYLMKPDGEKLRITVITGRENHDSIIIPGANCADPELPDIIKINDKNYNTILGYYKKNPFISENIQPDIKDMKRISIAPANPYWSPILPAHIEVYLPDAKKKRYRGLNGKEFIFYHRKKGCSYYDQYQSYIDSDVIIFNAAKYKIESMLDRKPDTDLEIIDEADEFLDSLSNQVSLNLTRLSSSLSSIIPDDMETKHAIDRILNMIAMEEANKRALGIDEKKIYELKETKLLGILKEFLLNPEIEDEIISDDANYVIKWIEAAKDFNDFMDETYLTFRKDEKELYANLVTTNLSKRFSEIVKKSKTIVLMSGTFHSEEVLKNVFGIKGYKIIEAETKFPGTMEICLTGKEFDCKYSNFSSKKYTKEDYLRSLSESVKKAARPILIHVNSFDDLPEESEISQYGLYNLPAKRSIMKSQYEDKDGKAISAFKAGLTETLFTTKCSRGADFPGDICNSIVFTKYPNPNINDTFWKILQKTHPKYFWDVYKDKANREFIQKIYRALRFKDDHVYILSPDSRVIDSVKELQIKRH